MPRVLVTGALGNVGTEVVLECLRRGLVVRAADRSESKLREKAPAQCETVRFDFMDPATWPAALAGTDHVFLLRPPPLGNMATTLNPFVTAAYAAGVRHIVFLSVAGADRMSWVPHHKVELQLQASGAAWTLLRPGFFAQNLGDAYRRDIVEDGRLFVPAGRGRVAFLDVRDVGEVAAKIFEDPTPFRGRALTLTGPAALTFAEVAELLSLVLGRAISYQPASVPGYMWHLRRKREMAWMQIAVQTFLHFGLRHGDAEAIEPTVQELLGRPARTMSEYLQRSAATWQAR